MRELYAALSHYNRNVNAILCGYIAKMTAAQLAAPLPAYYATFPETALHLLASDLKWLERLASIRDSGLPSSLMDAFRTDGKNNSDKFIDRKDDFIELRQKTDEAIVKLIAEIGDDDLPKVFALPFGKETRHYELWKFLTQWFNHQTHHRGQLSLFLDVVGIENDFSAVLDKME